MITADWIALAVLLGVALLGALIGFGRGLKFFTSGIFGIVFSVFLCYILGGLIYGIPFVQDLLNKFASLWANVHFLTVIHLEIIVYYILLFVVFQILRIIIVKILKGVFESKFILIKIINKVLGAVLLAGILVLLTLLVFQLISWVGGDTAVQFDLMLSESGFLGGLYRNNPLWALVNLG